MQQRWNGLAESRKQALLTAGILFLLAPFFEPGYVSVCVPPARAVYNIGQVLSTLIVFALFARNLIRRRRLSKTAMALIILEGWMGMDVLIHQGVHKAAFLGIISVTVVCMLIEVMVDEGHAAEMLEGFLLLYEILIGLNLVTMLIWPGGLYHTPMQSWDNWFIGYRNMFIYFFLPGMSLELVGAIQRKKYLRFYLALAVCVASMVMGGSATGLVSILLFALLSVTGLYRWKWINGVSVTAAWLAAFFAIVVFKVQTLMQPILDLLGRNATFTGRTGIWENTWTAIAQNPILGYGIQEESVRTQVTGNAVGITAHNMIFEQWYCFGVIGLLLLAVLIGMCAWSLFQCRGKRQAGALCIGLGCFFVVMLFEGELNNIPLMSFLYICALAHRLIEQDSGTEEPEVQKAAS